MGDFNRLRELIAKATPGPWRECGHDRGGCICGLIFSVTSDFVVAETGWSPDDEVQGMQPVIDERKANAALIVEAFNALPALLSIAEAYENAETQIVQATPYNASGEIVIRNSMIGQRVRLVIEPSTPSDGGQP